MCYFFASSCNAHGQNGSHLATCTFPSYRNYGSPDDDDEFCPFPPSVNSINRDSIGQPLEYMSYFVDEHLIDLSDNQIDTTDFFRQYMAGFVISTRETALSVCRSNETTFNSHMCQMIRATVIVEDNPTFIDTLDRQDYQNATNCTMRSSQNIRDTDNIALLTYVDTLNCSFDAYPMLAVNSFPHCPNFDFDNDTVSFVPVNRPIDVSQLAAAEGFRVDGAVRNRFEGDGVDGAVHNRSEGDSSFGRVHYAPPTSTQITGATVYYNNQVNN